MKDLLLVLGEMACDMQANFAQDFGDFSVEKFSAGDFHKGDFRALKKIQKLQKLQDLQNLQDSHTIILHPIADTRYEIEQIQYEIGTELGIMILLANAFLSREVKTNKDLDSDKIKSIKHILEKLSSFDFGHIFSESSLSEEEVDRIVSGFEIATNRYILLGRAFAYHSDKESIYKILGLLSKIPNTHIIAHKKCEIIDLNECLDSNFWANIESKLENLPESNGAFVYFAPQKRVKSKNPTLESTKQFLALAKCKNGDTITLKNHSITIACQILEAPYLRGVVGITNDFADTKCYPFVPLQHLIA